MVKLRDIQLQQVIPPNLTKDEKVRHLAQSLDMIMSDVNFWADRLNYKHNIADLPSDIIDHLLYEKHVTWNEGLLLVETHEQKVELLKAAIELHRKKGTAYSIERVFDILGLNAALKEWFEYDGDPYHFKIIVTVTERGLSQELIRNLETLVMFYKNVRSVLESIDIHLTVKSSQNWATGNIYGEEILIRPAMNNLMNEGELQATYALTSVYGECTIIYPFFNAVQEMPSKMEFRLLNQSGEEIVIFPQK